MNDFPLNLCFCFSRVLSQAHTIYQLRSSQTISHRETIRFKYP